MAIKFDPAQTLQQAKALDELAGDMQNHCVKKMSEISKNIEAAWSGNAAKAYLTYMRGAEEDLTKKAKYLRDTAEFLRTAVKQMQAAEAAAKQQTQNI